MTTNTITLPTSQLRKGDIVLVHGMRVHLTREPHVYPAHPAAADRHPHSYSYLGDVLNPDEVTDTLIRRWFNDGEDITGPHWTIQGNDLAYWQVEDDPDNCKACDAWYYGDGLMCERHHEEAGWWARATTNNWRVTK